jgi:hypothetical protein
MHAETRQDVLQGTALRKKQIKVPSIGEEAETL